MTKSYHVKGKEINGNQYHYTQCGLDDVYLLNGFKVHDTSHGKGVSIENAQDLHETIGHSLCHTKAILNNKEFRFLRKLMDITQAELSSLFACDVQTIARWEKGENQISGTADRLIRIIFLTHVCTKVHPLELIEEISKLDVKLKDHQVFKETKGEWKVAA